MVWPRVPISQGSGYASKKRQDKLARLTLDAAVIAATIGVISLLVMLGIIK